MLTFYKYDIIFNNTNCSYMTYTN